MQYKVAEKMDGSAVPVKQPFDVLPGSGDDEAYMSALGTLSTNAFRHALNLVAHEQAHGSKIWPNQPVAVDDSGRPVIMEAMGLNVWSRPLQPVSEPEVIKPLKEVFHKTGASAVVFLNVLGRHSTSGKTLVQSSGNFLAMWGTAIGTAIMTHGMFPLPVIPMPEMEGKIMTGALYSTEKGELVWSRYYIRAGDPLKPGALGDAGDLHALIREILYQPVAD